MGRASIFPFFLNQLVHLSLFFFKSNYPELYVTSLVQIEKNTTKRIENSRLIIKFVYGSILSFELDEEIKISLFPLNTNCFELFSPD